MAIETFKIFVYDNDTQTTYERDATEAEVAELEKMLNENENS